MSQEKHSHDHAAGGGMLAALHAFLRLESAGGIILVATMLLALVAVNSPLAMLYQGLLDARVIIGFGPLVIDKAFLLWINDGLMAVFFLLVALEIKREVLEGELSTPQQIALPAFAAVGGMAVPALLYAGFTWHDPLALRGWAIPSATDIAFSLGVLSLLGRRVPLSLRIFLTALAIIDDLGAILIIAFFYSHDLSVAALGGGGAAVAVLILFNRYRVVRLTPYLLVGAVLWVCLLKSGIHATIAGVVVGLCIPLRGAGAPLHRLEHGLHPWVAYGILPLFAFANSGLSFAGMNVAALVDPVFLGIAVGLFVGKQVGVFGLSWLAIRLRLGAMPTGATWRQMYGVCILTGIGFTMSLFIGGLAFPDGNAMVETKLGVIAGSVASALTGWALLASAPGKDNQA
ncbi:Na(+)/H(+) antiporter nhaA [Magnetospirillum gryphiswaldense MSR-1 v2]|uniref:Na(+)/H(+) antiporter NhaA n=2 Tax=Magnetospirillum gryphiswaldense TaxID=55518 RepID=V6F4G4_MAGGM|nr:Na(+)/H(+) antiporter nhaA [Magnetospirillum gryphiswaldense MSR-1 v2]